MCASRSWLRSCWIIFNRIEAKLIRVAEPGLSIALFTLVSKDFKWRFFYGSVLSVWICAFSPIGSSVCVIEGLHFKPVRTPRFTRVHPPMGLGSICVYKTQGGGDRKSERLPPSHSPVHVSLIYHGVCQTFLRWATDSQLQCLSCFPFVFNRISNHKTMICSLSKEYQ